MPGVNRSNVAVTDTFDTWRIRTNELNTSLNLGTNAITGNTVVWRDDDGSFTANVTTINTIAVTHNTTTTALTVTSALEAADDGSKASIVTTGGVLAALKSRFQDEVFVEGKLTTNSHAEFGDSAADTVEFNSTLVGDIVPNSPVDSDLGSSTKIFNDVWLEHGLFRANTTFTGSVIDMVSTSDLGANGINIVADSEDTGFGINVQMNALTGGGLFKVSSTSGDDTPRNLGMIHTNHASAPGTTGLLVQAESGRGVFIDTNLAAGGYALEIDAQQTTSNTAKIDSAATSGTMLELNASGVLAGTGKGIDFTAGAATTGTGLYMSMNALTDGKIMDLTSTSTSTAARSLVKITNDAVEAVGTTAFEIDSDAGRGIYINSGLAASLPSFQIDSSLATTNTAIITADATTDGTALEISADLLEDGRALDISSTSTNSAARRLVSITNDAAAATGTDALYIQSDAGKGIYVTSTLAAGGPSLDILSAHQTTDAINVVANALTTGGVLDISSSSTATNPRALATITQSGDVTTSGDTTGLKLAMTSGRGLFIDSDDANGAPAFEIDSEHATTNAITLNATTTTATGMDMAFGALTTGTGLDIRGTGAGMSTAGSLVEIQQTNALSSAANVATLSVMTAGNGAYGIKVNSSHATSNASVRIDSATTTKNIMEVNASAITSGDMLNMSVNQQHTGKMIQLTSTHAGDTARGEALHIQYDTANTAAIAMKIANSSATSFSVSQAGDVVMGGNLSVLGTTTQINTTTTVARDTAIVLGAQSEIDTGATYSAANPAVVTTTTNHGLSDNDIIFIVASSGTAIVSEQLVKVTSQNGTTGFTAQTIAGVNINGTGDSTTRTFSWTGPQTDAAVDDAGLIVPGDTAIHSIKWDDTDNYWELNDSTMINSTGQFVLPKGTSAQQPASSASATLAAATPGAQRYNTTNSKFEGVTTGTTWENMSSEAFAVAVSIALG